MSNEAHQHSAIEVAAPLAEIKVFKYTFREDKLGNKRKAVELNVPIPTFAGLVHDLADAKIQSYVLELVIADIYAAGKLQVNDDIKPVNKQSELDIAKLTLKHLAYLPPSSRSDSFPQEIKDQFAADYIALMPGIANKTVEQATSASALLARGVRAVKNNKKALKILQEQLAIFIGAQDSSKLEVYAEFVDLLSKRIQDWLDAEDAKPEDNL